MAYTNIDRTAQVDDSHDEIKVHPTDYCEYFRRHPDTFLQRRECWTCIFSDFKIETGQPTDLGICRYKLSNRI